MKDIELPPLPDPKYIWHDADEPGEAELFEFEFSGAVDGRCDICERLYSGEQMQSYARAAVEADRAQRLPDGWKLVPIEPTPKMLVALWEHRERMRGRGENAIAREGYSALLASTPAPAQRGPSQIKAEHKTVTPSGTVVTRLELTDKAKESLRANVTHIPGIAKHQEPPQQERKPMTPEQVGIVCDSAGYLENGMAKTDFINGIRHAERHHGIKE